MVLWVCEPALRLLDIRGSVDADLTSTERTLIVNYLWQFCNLFFLVIAYYMLCACCDTAAFDPVREPALHSHR